MDNRKGYWPLDSSLLEARGRRDVHVHRRESGRQDRVQDELDRDHQTQGSGALQQDHGRRAV